MQRIAKLMGCDTIEQAEERNWIMAGTEIDDDVAVPAAAPAAPRPRGRPRGTANKPKVASQAEVLEAALAFVSPVQNDIQPFAQYVNLSGNMAVMYNGQFAAGHPIIEELTLCPHLGLFQQALKRCGKSLAITQTEARQLSIKGDHIRVLIPCYNETLAAVVPDIPYYEGDFSILREALKVCGTLADEDGNRVVTATLLLNPDTCTGTNGHAMLQFWHGLKVVPPGTVIPAAFADAVVATNKKITGIGADWNAEGGFPNSVTFWFEGGAWIKTQCFHDRWPELSHILDVASSPGPVPVGLFEAFEAVVHFVDDKKSSAIYLVPGSVQSHPDATVGAQYEVPGLTGGKVFNGKLVKQVAPWVETIDLETYGDRAYFFGGTPTNPVRGAIMCMMG